MNIALIGPSGAGKGTHAHRLIEQFDLLHLDTGELFHENLVNHTAVGFLAKRYLSKGTLVPDEVVDAVVAERLWHMDTGHGGVLFDGFPRTVSQAQFLDDYIQELDQHLDAVIYLNILDGHIEDRLLKRLVCPNCHLPYHPDFNPPQEEDICDACGVELSKRPDDIPEMLRVRQRAFRSVVKPLLDYYQSSHRLFIIDAEGSIEEVSTRIIDTVETIKRKESRTTSEADIEHVKTVAAPPPPSTRKPQKKTKLNLILVGAPGSGKGTQAEKLRNEFQLAHIATGDLFRENLKNKTDLGKLAKSYMDRGALVPDEVTEAMVEDRLSREKPDSGFILDGFPRTLPQAKALTEIMEHIHRHLDGVLYIKVADAAIETRLGGRRVCRQCQTPYHLEFKPSAKEGICDACGGELYQRDDDNPATIHSRLETFHQQTAPIINFYKDAGLLIEIEGEGDVSTVTTSTMAAVAELQKELS